MWKNNFNVYNYFFWNENILLIGDKMFFSKYKYQILIILLVLFNICIVIKNKDNYFISEHVILTKNEEKKLELNIDKNQKYKILVYYPETKHKKLNNIINNKVTSVVSLFKNVVSKEKNTSNQLYTLNITYDSYEYKDFISYVFYIEYNIGEAHPNQYIWSVVYDSKNNEEITIEKLIKMYPNILFELSNYCRSVLKKDNKITNFSMMIGGTAPKKDNYSKFCFTNKGLNVYFERYQIAPYSSGYFVLTIPYIKFVNY